MRPAESIEKLIKQLRYTTSGETHDRVLDNVLQSLDKDQRQKSGTTRPDLWRTIMNTKTRKLATAAVILIATTIGLYIIAGPFSTTSTVYAEVAERLHKALTMTYTVTTSTPVEGMPEMEMQIAFKKPGLMRLTMPGGYVSVMDAVQSKGLSIIPDRKQFVEIDMSNLPDDMGHNQLSAIERMRSLPETADEALGEREIDGRTVKGFRVSEMGMSLAVWIDPDTRELVEIETEMVNAPEISGTITDIRFDVELPDELFSLEPPEGYTRLKLEVDASAANENDLIEFFRLWSSWTISNTFPPTLNPAELPKVAMEMAKAGEFGPDKPEPDDARLGYTTTVTRAMMFVMTLPADSNSQYVGENVQYGDADAPIFWYKPDGSETYRVVYGDLNVKEVAAEDLPQ